MQAPGTPKASKGGVEGPTRFPDSNREILYGGTLETASFLGMSSSPVYLFVQCWTGRKG
jgi:hypothetical protein